MEFASSISEYRVDIYTGHSLIDELSSLLYQSDSKYFQSK